MPNATLPKEKRKRDFISSEKYTNATVMDMQQKHELQRREKDNVSLRGKYLLSCATAGGYFGESGHSSLACDLYIIK